MLLEILNEDYGVLKVVKTKGLPQLLSAFSSM